MRRAFAAVPGYEIDTVDTVDIQPYGGDALLIRMKDGLKFIIELKCNLLSQSDRALVIALPVTHSSATRNMPHEQIAKALRATWPFADWRIWHYIFLVQAKEGYGYFVPKGVLREDELRILTPGQGTSADFCVEIPREKLQPFRVNINAQLGKAISRILDEYPLPELHAIEHRVRKDQHPKSARDVAMGIGHLRVPKGAIASWVFDKANSYLAKNRSGVLVPLVGGLQEGHAVLFAWAWTEAEAEMWQKARQLPTGIGLPSLPSNQPCIRVKLFRGRGVATYNSDFKPAFVQAAKGNKQEWAEKFLERLKKYPALCIFDMFGPNAADRKHSFYLVPSEFLSHFQERKRGGELYLRQGYDWAQFVAHEDALGDNMGWQMRSFLDPRRVDLPWTKSKYTPATRSQPRVRVVSKNIYATDIAGIMQRQVDQVLRGELTGDGDGDGGDDEDE